MHYKYFAGIVTQPSEGILKNPKLFTCLNKTDGDTSKYWCDKEQIPYNNVKPQGSLVLNQIEKCQKSGPPEGFT